MAYKGHNKPKSRITQYFKSTDKLVLINKQISEWIDFLRKGEAKINSIRNGKGDVITSVQKLKRY